MHPSMWKVSTALAQVKYFKHAYEHYLFKIHMIQFSSQEKIMSLVAITVAVGAVPYRKDSLRYMWATIFRASSLLLK